MKDLKEFWKKSQHDLIFTQATALAYTTLLSLVPLIAVAFFLFKAFGGFDDLLEQIQPFIESNLAPSFSDKISVYLDVIVNKAHAGTIGTLGLLGFILTSITTLTTIEKTFNVIWGVKKPRSFARRVTTYWTLLTVGPLLLSLSLVFGLKAFVWLKNDHGFIADVLLILLGLVPYLSSGLLFSVLFFFIPNVRVNIKDALKAGLATGIIFELAKLLYSIYANRTISHDALYGALIIIPVFLLWLYVVWLIVLFGAEFCCYLQFKRLKLKYKFNWEERLTPFAISDIMELLADSGRSKGGGLTAEEILSELQIPFYEVMAHLQFLEEEGWVITSKGKYHLSLTTQEINMSEVLKSLERHRYIPKGRLAFDVYQKSKALWKSE